MDHIIYKISMYFLSIPLLQGLAGGVHGDGLLPPRGRLPDWDCGLQVQDLPNNVPRLYKAFMFVGSVREIEGEIDREIDR